MYYCNMKFQVFLSATTKITKIRNAIQHICVLAQKKTQGFFLSLSFSPVITGAGAGDRRVRPGARARAWRAHGERTRQRRTSTSTRASERGGRRASAHRHANAQRGRADAAGERTRLQRADG